MHNLYIEDLPHPWLSWDNEVYRFAHDLRNEPDSVEALFGLKIAASPWQADVFFVTADAMNLKDPLLLKAKHVFVFIPAIPSSPAEELELIQTVKYIDERNWTIVTESLSAFEKFSSIGLSREPWLWRRPSRVPEDLSTEFVPWDNRLTTIATVLNAADPLSHISDLVKAYLGAYVRLRDDHNIEPDLVIFSHTDLPFEPFNEIRFEGFVSNKKLLKFIRTTTLFVWPCETDKYPNPLVEASQLGVPCLYYNPAEPVIESYNGMIFPDDNEGKYATVDELTDKIVEVFINEDYAHRLAATQNKHVWSDTQDFDIHMFLAEIAQRLETL